MGARGPGDRRIPKPLLAQHVIGNGTQPPCQPPPPPLSSSPPRGGLPSTNVSPTQRRAHTAQASGRDASNTHPHGPLVRRVRQRTHQGGGGVGPRKYRLDSVTSEEEVRSHGRDRPRRHQRHAVETRAPGAELLPDARLSGLRSTPVRPTEPREAPQRRHERGHAMVVRGHVQGSDAHCELELFPR